MRTEATFIISAALIHVMAIPLMAKIAPHPSAGLFERRELRPIEIEVTETPPLVLPRVTPDVAAVEPPPQGREEPAPPEAQPRAVSPVPRPQGVEQPEDKNPPPSPQPGPTGDRYDPVAPAPPGGVLNGPPGIGGPAIWQMPGVLPQGGPPPPAPTVAPKPRPVDGDIAGKLIRESMKTNDKAIGLDLPAAGTVASTLQTAVQASATPENSRASFEVRLSASGQVLSVRVLGTNGGDAGAWARVAQAAAASLAGRTLAMTGEYAKGAVVTVSINSVSQAPAGSSGGLEGAGARFDVSNLGAHKRRVVRVSHSVTPVR